MLHFGQWKFPPWMRLPHESQSLVRQQSDMVVGFGFVFMEYKVNGK
jgi:hypothetical protein